MVSILETSDSAAKTPHSTPPAQRGAAGKNALTVLSVVIVLLVIGGGVLAWFVYAQGQEQKAAVTAQVSPLMDAATKRVANLETRVAVGEEQAAKFKAQAEVYAERLGLTRKELDRMSSLAKKYREEWMTQIGALTGEMGQVKQKLDEHGKAIEETRGALQRAIGDLGEQSGLIARNYEEVQDLKQLRRNAAACRRAGMRLAADDVGAGNAGLRLLSEIHFDIVKVDLSLVQGGILHDPSHGVLRALQELAARWSATIIAEGVETSEQLAVIRDLGITAGQGYLLGRPMRERRADRLDLDALMPEEPWEAEEGSPAA